MTPFELYLVTLGVFAALTAIEALGFNLQFGYAGVVNVAFIVFVAVGAYATGVAELHRPPRGVVTSYVGGFGWGFFPSILFGAAATMACGAVIGLVLFRRLRHDYLALALLAISQGLIVLVTDDVGLFNGQEGITGVPGPAGGLVITGREQLGFLGISAAALVIVYVLLSRLTNSPFGRTVRAGREDADALTAIGKNPDHFRLLAFVIGCGIAGLSGGLFVTYVGGWNPSSWQLTETLILFCAVIVGGRGRHLGAVAGAIVLVAITQATTFIPGFVAPEYLPNVETMCTGLLILAFLWWRPEGIFPERRESIRQGSWPAGRLRMAPSGSSGQGQEEPADLESDLSASPKPTDRRASGRPDHNVALDVEDLACSFGGVQAVRGVSMEIARGRFVGLIGPNGAGKSTLVECLSGFNTTYKGRVRLFGADISRKAPHKIAALGLVRGFQQARVFGQMTSLDNIGVAERRQSGESVIGALAGRWRNAERLGQRRSEEFLSLFGMTQVRGNYGRELSGGQQRLLELARLLSSDPDVLLLDEPFVGVSPANRERLCQMLLHICHERHVTILMVEHRLELVERLCDSVVVMAEGKVIAQGPMSEIRSDAMVLDAYLGRAPVEALSE